MGEGATAPGTAFLVARGGPAPKKKEKKLKIDDKIF